MVHLKCPSGVNMFNCLCCAFPYHFLAWGMLQEVLSVWAAALQKAVCHLYTVEGGQCTRMYQWHPLLPKIVNAAPNQNIHWRICKGRQEEKQNIDVLFWWPKYWCSLLATKILMMNITSTVTCSRCKVRQGGRELYNSHQNIIPRYWNPFFLVTKIWISSQWSSATDVQ